MRPNLASFLDNGRLCVASMNVLEAKERFPQICPNGLHFYYRDKPEYWSDNDYAMVWFCRWYFLRAARIKTPSTNSYGLKHRIENHFTINGSRVYIHNGACIVAAMSLGFPVKQASDYSLNAVIGISRSSLRDLDSFTEELTNNAHFQP
jgi:hypothetical protein